jgi:hypothetical protein
MSLSDDRQAIADAIASITGLTGYTRPPKSVKAGDGWPRWRGSDRADGFAFVNTWAVIIALPGEEERADEWADRIGLPLAEALQDRDVLFVTDIDPAEVPVNGTPTFALMITGRSE